MKDKHGRLYGVLFTSFLRSGRSKQRAPPSRPCAEKESQTGLLPAATGAMVPKNKTPVILTEGNGGDKLVVSEGALG